MIKNITSNSPFITVTGGNSTAPYISPGAAAAGMLRWNPNMNRMEVNDGNSWIEMSGGYTSVDLTHEANDLLMWAREQKAKAEKLDELCKKYPGLQKARDNFEMFQRLVESDGTEQS